MVAFFGNRGRSETEQPQRTLPELPTTLPYAMRDEINWADFSMPINPLGTPKSILEAIHTALICGELGYRPDQDAYMFRRTVAALYEISPASVLLGASTYGLMRSAAQAQRISTVAVNVPSPIDCEIAIANAGHSIVTIHNPYSFATCDYATARRLYGNFDAALLANPSFPTSRLLSEEMLVEYLENCSWVVVDESFISLSLGGESFISLTERYKNLIIIRNLSATFALPGIPTSYMVAHPQTIEVVKRCFDSTIVSMIPEVISQVFPEQMEYLEDTHDFLEREIPWLQCMLSLIPGMKIFPAEGNYVLCSYKMGEGMNLGATSAKDLSTRLQLTGNLMPQLTNMVGLDDDSYFCVCAHNREDNLELLSSMKKIISKHEDF